MATNNGTSPDPQYQQVDDPILLSLYTTIGVSIIFFLVFLAFRRRFGWVYRPNQLAVRKHHVLREEGRFSWLVNLMGMNDASVLTLIGLDSFIFLQTLKMIFYLFFWMFLASFVVILPIYASGDTPLGQVYTSLSIIHLDAGSPLLWVPYVFVWLFSFFTLYFIFLYYSSYVLLRQAFVANPASLTSVFDLMAFHERTGSLEASYKVINLQSQTVLIEGLDKRKFRKESDVKAYMDHCAVGSVKEAVIIYEHKRLHDLVHQRNKTLQALEKQFMIMLKNILLVIKKQQRKLKGGKAKAEADQGSVEDATVRLIAGLPEALLKVPLDKLINCDRRENYTAVEKMELVQYALWPEFMAIFRPRGRTSGSVLACACCCGGHKHDLISFYAAKLAELDLEVEKERARVGEEDESLKILDTFLPSKLTTAIASPLASLRDKVKRSVHSPSNDSHHSPSVDLERQGLQDAAGHCSTASSDLMIEHVPLPDDSDDDRSSAEHFPSKKGFLKENFTFLPLLMHKDTMDDFHLLLPNATHMAFVTFEDAMASSITQQCLIDSDLFSCIVSKAPHPNDIIWENLKMPMSARSMRNWLGFSLLVLLNIFYSSLTAAISAMGQLETLTGTFPFLGFIKDLPDNVVVLILGFLPPLLLNICLMVIPYILHMISYYQGFNSRSEVQASLMRKYTFFLFLQAFLFVMLTGPVLDSMKAIEQRDFQAIVTMLQKSVPQKSSFFFQFILVRIAFDVFFSLANPVKLAVHILTQGIFTNQTPREKQASRQPEMVNYGVLYPSLMFLFPIVMTYSVSAPLMLLVGAAFYGFAYFVHRYQFLYASRTQFESGGEHWARNVSFFTFSLITFQLAMALQFSVQQAPLQAGLLLPLVALTIYIQVQLHKTYDVRIQYIPLSRRTDLAALMERTLDPDQEDSISRQVRRQCEDVRRFEDYSVLDLIATLMSRQKNILCEVTSSTVHLMPTQSSEDVRVDVITSPAAHLPREIPVEVVPIPGGATPLYAGESNSVALPETDVPLMPDTNLPTTLQSPYRDPVLLEKMNRLFLPHHFFRIVKIVRDDAAAKGLVPISVSTTPFAAGLQPTPPISANSYIGTTVPQ